MTAIAQPLWLPFMTKLQIYCHPISLTYITTIHTQTPRSVQFCLLFCLAPMVIPWNYRAWWLHRVHCHSVLNESGTCLLQLLFCRCRPPWSRVNVSRFYVWHYLPCGTSMNRRILWGTKHESPALVCLALGRECGKEKKNC